MLTNKFLNIQDSAEYYANADFSSKFISSRLVDPHEILTLDPVKLYLDKKKCRTFKL